MLERLGAGPVDPPRVTGAEAVHEYELDGWEGSGDLVGVFAAGDWAVAFEPGCHRLADHDTLVRLSAGTRLVAHSSTINGHDRFTWREDGGERLSFPLSSSDGRELPTTGEIVDAMRAVGFRFEEGDAEREESIALAFAPAEHLTGVELTEEVFEESEHLLGGVAAV
ncbi:hypothetical protein GCM10009678_76070 [Actinomadura kijaniata]|uniref:Uncharacterized protein n=1 Tax=Actinomadura namibiensis TaxID=182080 RepID=A0A7W3QS89_ACTNM|nr:DUF6461 domain-containing protein [Actinomadura namibiensis]MBA8957595.1 hypothetical protein [Actinomadura namibiensis]